MRTTLLIAIVLAALIGGWLYSGQLENGDADAEGPQQDAALEAPAEANLESADDRALRVRVRRLEAEPYDRHVIVRGRTEAVRWVDIKAEIDARVNEVLVEKGVRVTSGQVIARLDMANRAARMAEAQALVAQRQIEYEAAVTLNQRGHRGEVGVAQAAALLESAFALVTQIDEEIYDTEIRAPFDGVLEERQVEVGDYVMEGQGLATVVDQNPFLVVGQVSERDVDKIRLGAAGTAELIDGQIRDGHIRYIGTMAEPATRTFRIELEVSNDDRRLRDGVTAEIRIKVSTGPAHFVSPAVLTLDEDGVVGVRLVDAAGRVSFRRADIIGESSDGVWLGGLPAVIDLIVVGQEYVRDGDEVRVAREEDAAS